MPDPTSRKTRQDRHAREIEKSQSELRDSISKTQQLLDESDDMLKRHRRECDEEDEVQE
jgi:hypothetical protein